MKKIAIGLVFCIIGLIHGNSQVIRGVIVGDTSNLRIIKVWGSHYDRGYAVGFLDGERILNLYNNYIIPALGQAGIDTLKKYILEEKHFKIPEKYHIEAQGLADGITARYTSKGDFGYLDVLAANTFFDFIGFYNKNETYYKFGCSSLMSWGDATISTDLDGASVISRHLDWTRNMHLVNSSTLIAHIPDENDEQAWIMIGFAGQISALSGVNESGLGVFHHSLADFIGLAKKNKAYEPIWFTARNALEIFDFNSDMLTNTNDVRDAVELNPYGYANGSIFSVINNTDSGYDSLTAMVLESACEEPFHTFRYNDYDDLIPSDNLYAANASIKRNDFQNYEPRYVNIVNHIGSGTSIDEEVSWNLMKDYSNSGSSSIQFMQYIPQLNILKIAIADAVNYAYQKDPIYILIDTLFRIPASISSDNVNDQICIFPNPLSYYNVLKISVPVNKDIKIGIFDLTGKLINERLFYSTNKILFITNDFDKGIYFIKIEFENKNIWKS